MILWMVLAQSFFDVEPPSEPKTPKVVAEIPFERRVYTLGESFQQSVKVNRELPKKLTQLPPPEELIGFAPSDLPDWDSSGLPKEWSPISYLNDGDVYHIDWRQEDAPGCNVSPCVYDKISKQYFYGPTFDSRGRLGEAIDKARRDKGLRGINPTGEYAVGSIDRRIVEQVLDIMGETGNASLSNKEKRFDWGKIAVVAPPGMTLQWTPSGDGTHVVFGKKLLVDLKAVKRYVSAVTISAEEIKLHIDWFPDITLVLEDS